MTVESASFISQLNGTLPLSGDPKSEGDNHLRLIKTVLQNQFPNLGAAQVLATAEQLSALTRPMENRRLNLNGDFKICQYGDVYGASTRGIGYFYDGWQAGTTGSTVVQSGPAFTLGQTAVPGEPGRYYRCAVTSVAGAANYAIVHAPMESVRTGAGQQVTVSGYVKADANRNIAIEFLQSFGTGGSSQVAVADPGGLLPVTTNWTFFKRTITLPSISGKVLGADDYLGLTFWLDAGSSFNSRTSSLGQQSGTFDFARIQVELGDVATPFVAKTYSQELVECQRRRIECGLSWFVGQGIVMASNLVYMNFFPPCNLRKAPTITSVIGSGGWDLYSAAGISKIASLNTIYGGPNGAVAVSITPAASLTAGQAVALFTFNQGLTISADY